MNVGESDCQPAPLLTVQDLQNSLVERTLQERQLVRFDDDVAGSSLDFVDFDLDSTSNEKLLEDIDLHLQQNILNSAEVVTSSTKVQEYIYASLEAPLIDNDNDHQIQSQNHTIQLPIQQGQIQQQVQQHRIQPNLITQNDVQILQQNSQQIQLHQTQPRISHFSSAQAGSSTSTAQPTTATPIYITPSGQLSLANIVAGQNVLAIISDDVPGTSGGRAVGTSGQTTRLIIIGSATTTASGNGGQSLGTSLGTQTNISSNNAKIQLLEPTLGTALGTPPATTSTLSTIVSQCPPGKSVVPIGTLLSQNQNILQQQQQSHQQNQTVSQQVSHLQNPSVSQQVTHLQSQPQVSQQVSHLQNQQVSQQQQQTSPDIQQQSSSLQTSESTKPTAASGGDKLDTKATAAVVGSVVSGGGGGAGGGPSLGTPTADMFADADSNSACTPSSKTFVPCKVCGDKASGYHYGVTSCEGCKGFFRRSIQKQIEYRCLRDGKCLIIRLNRNRCQYCRFKKCLAVGMSRDSVRYGRVPKKSKEKERLEEVQQQQVQQQISHSQQQQSGLSQQQQAQQHPQPQSQAQSQVSKQQSQHCKPGITQVAEADQSSASAGPGTGAGNGPSSLSGPGSAIDIDSKDLALYDTILTVSQAHHANCSYTEEKIKGLAKKPIFIVNHIKQEVDGHPEGVNSASESLEAQKIELWEQLAVLITPCIQRVVEFAKRIPGFCDLTQDDQLILIKLGFFELWIVHIAKTADFVEQTITFSDGSFLNRQQLELMFDPEFCGNLFHVMSSFNAIGMSDTEIGLFSAMILLQSDRPQIYDIKSIIRLQENIVEALKVQMARAHGPPEASAMFSRLLSKINELRAIGSSHCLHLHWFRSNWHRLKLPPLFAEIFDIPRGAPVQQLASSQVQAMSNINNNNNMNNSSNIVQQPAGNGSSNNNLISSNNNDHFIGHGEHPSGQGMIKTELGLDGQQYDIQTMAPMSHHNLIYSHHVDGSQTIIGPDSGHVLGGGDVYSNQKDSVQL